MDVACVVRAVTSGGAQKGKYFFCKEVFNHYVNLLCATKAQVYTQIMHLFWTLAPIFSIVSIFSIYISLLIVCPLEPCSDVWYATYCAFVPSRMHRFEV